MVGGAGGKKSGCRREEERMLASGQPAEASWRKIVAMLRGGGLMLPNPKPVHTKELMAASSLSGLTACTSHPLIAFRRFLQFITHTLHIACHV